jgi:hypothetical protein
MKSDCRDNVLLGLGQDKSELPPEVIGWIDYLCKCGFPSMLIAEDIKRHIAWNQILNSLLAKGHTLSDPELLDIMRRFKSGKLSADDVFAGATKGNSFKSPKLK